MTFDLDGYLAIPRLSGLRVGGSGRVVVSEETVPPGATEFATAVVEIDPVTGGGRRLTEPRHKEGVLALLADGSVLLSSRRRDPTLPRPDPAADKVEEDDDAALWLLPSGPGEARRSGGPLRVTGARAAQQAGGLALVAEVLPGASAGEEEQRRRARREAGGTGLWFDSYPIRFWDHHLAPGRPRLLFAADAAGLTDARELTGDALGALREAVFAVTPDGRSVVTTWEWPAGRGARVRGLVSVDTADGERRTLLRDPALEVNEVTVSPDGRRVAAVVTRLPDRDRAPRVELWLGELAGGELAPVDIGDRWPHEPVFAADSTSLFFRADEEGRGPVFRLALPATAAPVRLTGGGAYTDLAVLPDGSAVLALRSTLSEPPAVVALDPAEPDQKPRTLYAAEPAEPPPGRIEEVAATAEDGTPLRAWLVLPAATADAEPAPLVVFIHGGPLGSWNSWQWRWQPHLLAARGYAVLLPDPALSTGYGQAMIERGWTEWGGTPYTDVLALTDAALAHPDVDASRSAVAGGSYGGYLTNWVIGHTDRFVCAVTHASLWSLPQFHDGTDDVVAWERLWGSPREDPDFYRRWSPATYLESIRTPVLVVHGERDYRVPIAEALAMWTDLCRRGVDSRLLLFPDENHWILRPGNIRTWYGAVLGWLDHHLRGEPLDRPPLT